MAIGHDRGVVFIVEQGRILVVHPKLDRGDSGLFLVLGDDHVIGREANLPGIHHLAHGNAFAGLFQIGALAQHDGRFAAQFQRYRHKIAGRRFHNLAARSG